tara:strand:+ start:396 stop:605 length:210 start_codon:yes stop_codon:yes gene_type:complete
MELVADEAITLIILLMKKIELEKKIKKACKSILLKCFKCCGLNNIQRELEDLNREIIRLQSNKNKITLI